MSRLLLAVGLWRLCAAYAPIGRRRCLVPLRAETEDRAEQIKKLGFSPSGASYPSLCMAMEE